MAQRPLTPGRRGKAPHVGVRTTPAILDALDRVAEAEGRRRSDVLRDVIADGLRVRGAVEA